MKLMSSKIPGLKPALAHFNCRIWEKLHPTDQQQIQRIITNTAYRAIGVRGRSLTYMLRHPIQIGERTIFSIRLKGIAPKLATDGTIPAHRGGGYVARPIMVEENGLTRRKEIDTDVPEGGALVHDCQTEFEVAAALSPACSDFALGYGTYTKLRFNGSQPGFVAFAQEDLCDLRFARHFVRSQVGNIRYCDLDVYHFLRTSKLAGLAYMFGQSLRTFHKDFAHRYPHQDNLGIIVEDQKPKQVKIRDLESCLALAKMTPEQRFSYLILDLVRVITDFCGNQKADDGERFVNYNLVHLLPYFLRGYFNGVRYPRARRSNDRQSVLFLFQLMNEISQGKEVNLPQVFAECPMAFVCFLHQQFAGLASLG